MKNTLSPQDMTPEVKAAVADYLAKRVVAETTREQVTKVQQQILREIHIFYDAEFGGTRITDPADVYMCSCESSLNLYDEKCHDRLITAGVKPLDMIRDYCPACVAESEQIDAEWAMMDEVAKMLDLDIDGRTLNHRLMCEQYGMGLERRQQFIDLVVGSVGSATGGTSEMVRQYRPR